MRSNIFTHGGNPSTQLVPAGATGNFKLLMSRLPVESLEAATVDYVGAKLYPIDASQFNHGYLSKDVLPLFSGDIGKSEGSNYINIAPVNENTGLQYKVEVVATGRAISGSLLVESDIPTLNWSKLTSGLPTTLDGYGIVNGLSTSGGEMRGLLTILPGVLGNKSVLSKHAVEVLVGNGTNICGEVVYKLTNNTPEGFLRPNGALASKTAYSALYAVIGDQYDPSTTPVIPRGTPWVDQHIFNMSQKKALGSWTPNSVVLPTNLSHFPTAVLNGRLYTFGGKHGTSIPLTEIRSVTVNPDGSLGSTWELAGHLPNAYYNGSVFILGDYVYYLEGERDGVIIPTTIYRTTVNTDGTLNSWDNVGVLPVNAKGYRLMITNSKLYVIGGYVLNPATYSKMPISTIYVTDILPDNSIGTWVLHGSIPEPRHGFALINARHKVYLVGGRGNGSVTSSLVYTADLGEDDILGTWTQSTSVYPIAVSGAKVVTTKSKAYILGGDTSNNGTPSPSTKVYSVTIAVDGTIGNWEANNDLLLGVSNAGAAVVSGKLYMLGGDSVGSLGNVGIYSTPFIGGCNDYIGDSVNWKVTLGPDFYLPTLESIGDILHPYIKY